MDMIEQINELNELLRSDGGFRKIDRNYLEVLYINQ